MGTNDYVPDPETIARLCTHIGLTAAHYRAITASPLPEILVPTARQLSSLVTTTFWASMAKEEGRFAVPSLLLATAEACEGGLHFQQPFALAESPLARLAPAYESPQTHFGV